MNEKFGEVFSLLPGAQLNVLLLIGLALFGGVLSGRFFQKLRVPQVVGYISLGIVLGSSGLNIIDRGVIEAFAPFHNFALALIGFMIGGELHKEVFLRHNKQFLTILTFVTLAPFLLVSLLIGSLGTLAVGDRPRAIALGLLLGAIANATAPANTLQVIREYRTRGPLTRTVINVVALADVSALLLFVIASSFAGSLAFPGPGFGPPFFLNPFREIMTALAIGGAGALVLRQLLQRFPEPERRLVFSLGAVLSVTGLAVALHADMILAAMVLGAVVTNAGPARSRDTFRLLEAFTPPIYILFFILVGAKLDITHLTGPIMILLLLYVTGSIAGKICGAGLGARLAASTPLVRRHLPVSLLSQGGVSIGLAILAAAYFPGEIGSTILIVVTGAVFITQLVGPSLLKTGLLRAGEAGLDVTAADYTRLGRVRDIMDAAPVRLRAETGLPTLLKTIGETNNLFYPVVNDTGRPLGTVSVENIRKLISETDIGGLILATDIMDPLPETVTPDTTLAAADEIFHRRHLECLAVLAPDGTLAGFLEKNRFERGIEARLLEIQHKVDALEQRQPV